MASGRNGDKKMFAGSIGDQLDRKLVSVQGVRVVRVPDVDGEVIVNHPAPR
jgi:hypothetical protein